MMRHVSAIVLALAVTAAASDAQSPTAHAVLENPDGERVGTVYLTEASGGGVMVEVSLTRIAAGVHGFHIHETGSCSPDFTAAGGHFAPDGNDHGFLHAGGRHAGDMLNINVRGGERDFVTQRLADQVTLQDGMSGSLFDEDGSAIVIHAGPDDYASQPSGAAGDRIACGVVQR